MSVSCSDCISELLCDENSDDAVFSAGGDYSQECSTALGFQPPETEESIAGLLEEERYLAGISSCSTHQPIDASVRTESVAWILKVQRYYSFQPLTALLSINYFDRFLYFHCHLPKMNGWPQQLLSVVCLSIAAKMEEPLVPSLLDLQVEDAKFIFEPRVIQRMELLVLSVLDWRLRCISPFCFLHFFSLKVDPTGSYTDFLTSRAKEIILSTIEETSLLEYRPSSIAAAAVVCAASDLPNLSSITAQDAHSWCDGLHNENIVSCHQLIRQINSNVRPKRQLEVLPKLRVTYGLSGASSDSSSSSSLSSSSFKRR